MDRFEKFQPVFFLIVFLFAGFILLPLLHGGFFLDDWSDLSILSAGDDGAISNVDEFLALGFDNNYIFTRALSYWSFLFDANAWPADPSPFKKTNLFLHLFNGLLVFLLLRKILTVQGKAGFFIALFASFLWVISPLNQSAVYQVVQRMTMLMTLFTLVSLIVFLYVRCRRPDSFVNFLGALIAASPFCLAALFSKESGFSVVFYIAILELFVVSSKNNSAPEKFSYLMIFSGLLIVPMLFYMNSADYLQRYDLRDFTLGERLLSEGRILMEYVAVSIVPYLSKVGLFHDDYLVSRSLLSPVFTLVAYLIWCALFLAAVFIKNRWFCLCLLWFTLGHYLEAGPFPLELYFDHRNYMPDIAIYLGLSLLMFKFLRHSKLVGGVCVVGYSVVFLFLARESALLWGDSNKLLHFLAEQKKQSFRAQEMYVRSLLDAGEIKRVRKAIDEYRLVDPEGLTMPMFLYGIERCDQWSDGVYQIADQELLMIAAAANYRHAVMVYLSDLMRLSRSEGCKVNKEMISRLVGELGKNENFQHGPLQAELMVISADLAFQQQQYALGLQLSWLALKRDKTFGRAINLANLCLVLDDQKCTDDALSVAEQLVSRHPARKYIQQRKLQLFNQ